MLCLIHFGPGWPARCDVATANACSVLSYLGWGGYRPDVVQSLPEHHIGSADMLARQLAAFAEYGVPALAWLEDGVGGQEAEIFKAGVGLAEGWEAALEARVAKIKPHFGPDKAIRGVGLGDVKSSPKQPLLSHHCLCAAVQSFCPPPLVLVSCRRCAADYEPYTSAVRRLLGPSCRDHLHQRVLAWCCGNGQCQVGF